MELIDFQWSSFVSGLYLASDTVGVGQDGHAEIDCSPFTISEEGHGMDRLMITICHVGPINVNCSRGAVRHSVTIERRKTQRLAATRGLCCNTEPDVRAGMGPRRGGS